MQLCIKDFYSDLSKEEKICLAKCNDKIEKYLAI